MAKVLDGFPDLEQALSVFTARENLHDSKPNVSASRSRAPSINQKVLDETKKACSTTICLVLIIKKALMAAVKLFSALREANSSLLKMTGSTVWNPALLHLSEAINPVTTEESTDFRDLKTTSLQGSFITFLFIISTGRRHNSRNFLGTNRIVGTIDW